MVRKDGYFSITDACIKHCRASFNRETEQNKKKIKKKKILQIFFA